MFFRALLTDSVYLETDQGLLFDSVSVYLFVTSLTNTETRSLASYFLTLDVILDYVILSLDHTTIKSQLSSAQGPFGEQENISHTPDEKPT